MHFTLAELKQEIREFEASFVEKYNRNPSNSEKEPIRAQLEELTHLRQQRKLAREQSGMERTGTAEGKRQRLTQSAAERQATGKEKEQRTRPERKETPEIRGRESQQDTKEGVSAPRRKEELGQTSAHLTPSHTTSAPATITVKPASEAPSQETVISPPATAQPLQQMEKILQKLMATLSEKRRKAGRPEELMVRPQNLKCTIVSSYSAL